MSGSEKKANPRDHAYQFTCTFEEASAILAACKEAQKRTRSLTMSGFLRDVVMNGVENSEALKSP